MSESVPSRLRRLVRDRARRVSEYGMMHESDAAFVFQIDHIISRKQRGPTTSTNLALACLRCNVAKGTDPGAFVGRPPQLTRLYHPRMDVWSEHFKWAGARILPLTDVGAATIKLLDLNGSDRLLLRRELIKAGRYPSADVLAIAAR